MLMKWVFMAICIITLLLNFFVSLYYITVRKRNRLNTKPLHSGAAVFELPCRKEADTTVMLQSDFDTMEVK